MKTVEMKVKGMHCASCAKLIEQTLSDVEGIESAKASYADENAAVRFDEGKISLGDIKDKIKGLGYSVDGSTSNTTVKEGLLYGLVPHIGCIGFIAASILGATVAVEFFKPLLMNPWFFHILILISIGFATLSSAIYLRKNGVLSWKGVKRKKRYLATMYGVTVGINLVLFLAVFPALANLDTGSFAEQPAGTGLASLAESPEGSQNSQLRLQVNIPCPGHAPLISGELKTIGGVTGVRYAFPKYVDVAFDSGQTSKEEILSLEVFETYPATLLEGEAAAHAIQTASLVAETIEPIQTEDRASEVASAEGELRESKPQQASSGEGSCSGSGSGSCGGSCGALSCGCGAK